MNERLEMTEEIAQLEVTITMVTSKSVLQLLLMVTSGLGTACNCFGASHPAMDWLLTRWG